MEGWWKIAGRAYIAIVRYSQRDVMHFYKRNYKTLKLVETVTRNSLKNLDSKLSNANRVVPYLNG